MSAHWTRCGQGLRGKCNYNQQCSEKYNQRCSETVTGIPRGFLKTILNFNTSVPAILLREANDDQNSSQVLMQLSRWVCILILLNKLNAKVGKLYSID